MKRNLLTLFVTIVLGASLASAQASRTWVSGVGDDANPCSRTAPCKTFAGAISKTAAGGEIDALDPGGFGAVTITKAITIDGGGGQVASVLVSGTNGIVVQANASTDVVILRNLRINGISSGLNGIQFNSGKALVIQNCDIFGFTQNGINITTAGGKVVVDGTTSRNNTASGLAVQSSATTSVSIFNSQFDFNQFGVLAGSFSQVTATNSAASANSSVGFIASGGSGNPELNLVNSTASNNAGAGVQAGGGVSPATVRVSGVALHDNAGGGFAIGANGTIKSFGNNFNSGAGTPTAPNLAPQ
ncbi:MAG: right-handed parallel beta-helix repeat-containing protein [Acidobacteriia bacterium]|nr:right-handed parallel beta-helix repeat-containing protein [Terriglobia bacterium]